MSYVPDYVRKVQTPRQSSTAASPSTPNSGSSTPNRSTPSRSRSPVTDGQFFPRNRRRTSMPISGTWVSPQNKVCSRQSISERVKNLEHDASVRLKVRQYSTENYRRRSGLKYPKGSSPSTPNTPTSGKIPQIDGDGDEQLSPTPDIIRSHVKPTASRQQSSPVLTGKGDYRKNSVDSSEDRPIFVPPEVPERIESPESDEQFEFGSDIEETAKKGDGNYRSNRHDKMVINNNNIKNKPQLPLKTVDLRRNKAKSNNNKEQNNEDDVFNYKPSHINGNNAEVAIAAYENGNKPDVSDKLKNFNDSNETGAKSDTSKNEISKTQLLNTKLEKTNSKRQSNNSGSRSQSQNSSRKNSSSDNGYKSETKATTKSNVNSPKVAVRWNKPKTENGPVKSSDLTPVNKTHEILKSKTSEPSRKSKKYTSAYHNDMSSLHKAASFPKLSMSTESSVEDIPEKVKSQKLIGKRRNKEVSRSFSLLWKAPSKETISRMNAVSMSNSNLTSEELPSTYQVDVDKVRHRSSSLDPVLNDTLGLISRNEDYSEKVRNRSISEELQNQKPIEKSSTENLVRRRSKSEDQHRKQSVPDKQELNNLPVQLETAPQNKPTPRKREHHTVVDSKLKDIPVNNSQSSIVDNTKENSENTPKQVATKDQVEQNVPPAVQTRAVYRRKVPESLILDVETQNETVPVELRSPRNENHSSVISRQAARDKRNARVFIMPSSDSDNEQLFANFVRNTQTPKSNNNDPSNNSPSHIQPVKFVPSLLQRNYAKSISSSGTETSPKSSPKKSSNTPNSVNENNKLNLSRDVTRRKHSRSMKRSGSRSKSTDARPVLDSSNRSGARQRSSSFRSRRWDGPSPRQQEVAAVVKYGSTANENVQIPYIDDHHQDDNPILSSTNHTSLNDEPTNHAAARVLPIRLRRGNRHGRSSPPRRESYMAAIEVNGNITPDDSSSDANLQNGVMGRSNSADSILGLPLVQQPTTATASVVRRRPRAKSVDRNANRGVHRRSYQMATSVQAGEQEPKSTPKRQPSIHKLKNFFGENTPTVAGAAEELHKPPSLIREASQYIDLTDQYQSRAGFLNFKVATIEKGKRSSSQKSWKNVWAVIINSDLFLCKDWWRNKSNQELINNMTVPNKLQLEEDTLDVSDSLVSIAYNYQKKKNVFKLTTVNGSEYLFQAEDSDDMLAWIRAIQDSAHGEAQNKINEDLILRKTNQIEAGILTRSPSIYRKQQSPRTDKRVSRKRSPKANRRNNNVPLKDVDGSRRFKWRGSVNKIVKRFGTGQPFMAGGTFEVYLEDCPPSKNNEFVPFVVDLCCKIVEARGLNFTGIYRVPGNNASLTLLKDDLNAQGVDAYQGDADERFRDLNVVSSLLKLFFRKLPDPLFTNDLYYDFIQMNRKPDPQLRLKGLRQLCHMLPAPHYETLKFLILHLRKVADNSAENKMEVRNLAIVFGPTLVRSTASDNMTTMVQDMSDQCRIVESIIDHAEWFFKDGAESDSSENILAPPREEKAHEPVPSIGYLLANVGRTPGDTTSDNVSESSKSKHSSESEKDSFSRDVIEMLFGRKNKKEKQDIDSADEHGGFEDQVPEPLTPVAPPVTQPTAPKSTNPMPQPLYNAKDEIHSRLYDFYCEHLDKMSKTNLPQFSSTESSPQVTPRVSQFEPPQFSIPDVAMVEKRHVRQRSDGNPCGKPQMSYGNPHIAYGNSQLSNGNPQAPFGNTHNVYGSQFKSLESLYKSEENLSKNASLYNNSSYTQSHSTPLREKPVYKPPPNPYDSVNRRGSDSKDLGVSDGSSLGALADDESSVVHVQPLKRESDSDTSIYIGESLEEQLKTLTNLDKKIERRPSQRRKEKLALKQDEIDINGVPYHEKLVDEPVPEQVHRKPKLPPKPVKVSSTAKIVAAMTSPILGRRAHLKRTNPSVVAGELVKDSEPKKSAQKLYDERRIQREFFKQQRQIAKAEKKKLSLQTNSQPPVKFVPLNGGDTFFPHAAAPNEATTPVTPDSDAYTTPAFNRMDPKRRVMARTHEEHHVTSRTDQNIPPTTPKNVETKRKSFQKKMKKVARRHTLGAGDFPDSSFWENDPEEASESKKRNSESDSPKFSPPHASTSLCDLTAAENNVFNQQLSAVDRLLPKGMPSNTTISGWMIQERIKNRTKPFNRPQQIAVGSSYSKSYKT